MNILGTIYLIDEPHINVLQGALMNNPPPGGRMAAGTMICMDMDEGDNMLELQFPDHCQKATLLMPPPIAMYREIDGDAEGFIEMYNAYLDDDDTVQEFISDMLFYLHKGGNILIYTPTNIDAGAIWLNTFMLYFYTRYGITIGSGPNAPAAYDPKYDGEVADAIYKRGFMDVFDYINSTPNMIIPPIPWLSEKLYRDLLPFTGPDENPLEVYSRIKYCLTIGYPVCRPVVVFDH